MLNTFILIYEEKFKVNKCLTEYCVKVVYILLYEFIKSFQEFFYL